MVKKGQIVEIPAASSLYKRENPDFLSKKDELLWKSHKKEYSLFDGFIVGEHSGVENFIIGQRKGINVGGKKEPLYVIFADHINNRVFVGAGDHHPGLWSSVIFFKETEFRWNPDFNSKSRNLEKGLPVEISSPISETKIPAVLYVFDQDLFLEFENPVSLTITNYPIDIFYHNTIIANI